MNPNQILWEMGDFTRIAASMRASGEDVVKQAGIGPGMLVLDLGCGDGTTAIPAAQQGAQVLGVDIAANLVAAANRRAERAGVAQRCTVHQGDACELKGIENTAFDVVLSMFGAMFAPRPFDVAREMVRVTQRGGRIVMGNWIPNHPSLVAQLLKISSSYAPTPPPGFISPMTWGVEDHVIVRFGEAGIPPDAISCVPDTYVFDFDGTPAEFVDTFRTCYGPTMNAFEAAEKQSRTEELHAQLLELFERENRCQYPGRTIIPARFLKVTVQVP